MDKDLIRWANMTEDEWVNTIEDCVHETLTKRAERQAKQNRIIKAGNLTVGCQIAEADGYLFDVVEVVKETAKTITVRVASDFSSIRTHWAVNGGVLKTFRKSTSLYGIVA